MASLNFPVNQKKKNAFVTSEKLRKLNVSVEQKQPIGLIKTIITHTAA